MSTIEEIARGLGRGREHTTGNGYITCCPAHHDHNPSLSLQHGSKQPIVWHCHRGCSQDAVKQALLSEGYTLDRKPGRLPRQARRVVKTYDYRDQDGELRYQVQRWATGNPDKPKEFKQRRPDPDRPGHWIDNIDGVTPLPYRLPEMLAEATRTVYIVEGEKDVQRLAEHGLIATTNSGGATKPKAWQQIRRWFDDRDVVIVPDNDEAGRQHIGVVTAALNGVARSIKVVELPDLPPKGDVSDWLDAGNNWKDIVRLAGRTPLWVPSAATLSDSADDDTAKDDDDAEIERLAGLSLIEFDRERKAAAERLGVRLSVLQELVEAKRPKTTAALGHSGGHGGPLEFAEITPWEEPVDGAELLDDLAQAIRRYIVLEHYQAEAIALWVVFTHAFAAFEHAPKIAVTSSEKRSGKSRLLGVLHRLVHRSLLTSGINPAALLRTIDGYCPTLLLDEFDALIRSGAEMSEALRGLLDSGFDKAHASFIKDVPVPGGGWQPHRFSTWCPQVLAGIGKVCQRRSNFPQFGRSNFPQVGA